MNKVLILICMAATAVLNGVAADAPAIGEKFRVTDGEFEILYRVLDDNGSVSAENIYPVDWDYSRDGQYKSESFVMIPETVEYDGQQYRVTEIGAEPVTDVFYFKEPDEVGALILPSSIENISTRGLLSNYNFSEIKFSEECKSFDTVDGILLSKDGRRLYRYPVLSEIYPEIPSSVEMVEPYAYKGCVEPLPVPEGMDEIPEGLYAFGSAAMPFPSTIKKVGPGAFYIYKMFFVTLPEGVEEIGYRAFYKGWNNYVHSFDHDWSAQSRKEGYLTFIDFPSTIKTIGEDALLPVRWEWIENQWVYEGYPQIVWRSDVLPESFAVGLGYGDVPLLKQWDFFPFYSKLHMSIRQENSTNIRESYDSQLEEFLKQLNGKQELSDYDRDELNSSLVLNTFEVIPEGDVEISEWEDGVATLSLSIEDKYEIVKNEWSTEGSATIENGNQIVGKRPGYANVYCKTEIKADNDTEATFYFSKSVRITPDRVGVTSVEADRPSEHKGICDLIGRRYNCSQNDLAPGLYVIDGKKTVIR